MKFLSYDSPFVKVFLRIGELMVLNILYLLCSLPVLTLGASTTALYQVIINLRSDTGSGVFVSFFRAFRDNFRRATLIFLVLLLPTLLVIYELWLYLIGVGGQSVSAVIAYTLPSILLVFTLSYVYPLTAQFDNTVIKTIKNAILLSIANIPATILIAFFNLIPLILLIFYSDFFLRISIIFLLLGFSSIAYLNSFTLLRVFRKYIENCEEA